MEFWNSVAKEISVCSNLSNRGISGEEEIDRVYLRVLVRYCNFGSTLGGLHLAAPCTISAIYRRAQGSLAAAGKLASRESSSLMSVPESKRCHTCHTRAEGARGARAAKSSKGRFTLVVPAIISPTS